MEIRQWLRDTTARDIMACKVVSVWPTHTLAQVAAVLLRENISGVPVVDQEGRCRGVFSVSDILRAEEKVAEARAEAASSAYFRSELALPASVYREQLEQLRDKIAPAAEQPVGNFMVTDLVTVKEDTRLEKIVASIVDAHVHRILVLDDGRQLRGLITTIDVMNALMRTSQDC